jgi:hypothetical protein
MAINSDEFFNHFRINQVTFLWKNVTKKETQLQSSLDISKEKW